MEKFQIINVPSLPPAEQPRAIRTNALGSLYYFIKVALRRVKLTDDLHLPLCLFLERDHIKDVIEWPRDHFKTTIGPEGLLMWRVLPFENRDEDEFSRLGYSQEFCNWMRRRHNPDSRNLTVSENVTNAAKIGFRVRTHFESNALFRSLFPEILPDSSCVWTNMSLHIRRRRGGEGLAHGEGTFDYVGVGGALQSRHYNGMIIQDDLVGRKAIESQSVMEKTIEFHQLVSPLFEDEDVNHDGDELVIGNRWGWSDLNSFIREHEPWMNVTRHSALGGCCPMHPPDTPICPTLFSYEKLMRRREKLGAYKFSCQFLNNPSAPENAEFKESDIQWYYLKTPLGGGEPEIVHEVKNGEVRKRIKVSHLSMVLVSDPNHSGQAGSGRARHANVVVGLDWEGNYYLLDAWMMGCSYPNYFGKLYEMALKWKIKKVGFESIAAQKFAIHHIKHLNMTQPWKIKITECKGEVTAPDGTVSKKKKWRIYNTIANILESGHFWMQKRPDGVIAHQEFLGELTTFSMTEGGGRYLDGLDAWAYAPNLLKVPTDSTSSIMRRYQNQMGAKQVGRPYSVVQ